MPIIRRAVKAWSALASLALASVPLALACSSSEGGPVAGGPSLSGQAGKATSGNGGSGVAGAMVIPGAGMQSGGTGTGGAASGGNAGTTETGGAAGSAPGGSGGMGLEDGDTPPWRPLMIEAALGEHQHGNAGMDTRAPKMLGKLAVDIGVNSGGYISWLAKRGYHSMGAPCGSCPAPDLGNNRDDVGNCRLDEFKTTETSVKATLTMLAGQYPEEDWGYFLNQDGSVRWSDVAITGISHGATTSALAGRIGARMWRVVSRSGPRDNTCGLGDGKCTAPLSTPSYDAACPDADVAAWLDQPSKTPMNRFYGIVGMGDSQCGDIMFDMHRTQFIGVPTIFDNAGAVLTGTNQFFAATGGHDDFLRAPDKVARTEEVLNIAFAIPPENQNPDF